MKGLVRERSCEVIASKAKIPNKKMEVFYNPVMKHNRDISVLLLYLSGKKEMNIALPLCGSGVRGIRLIKELPADQIKKVYFNDASPTAFTALKENIRINHVQEKSEISNKKADVFFTTIKVSFDYIDIDPFGSPIYFIANAIRKLRKGGIIALTATDTSSLCGTYPRVCLRRYLAYPLNNPLMYEVGVRILIGAVQREVAKYGMALFPLLSYYKDHYIRIFLKGEKNIQKLDSILKTHQYLHFNEQRHEFKIAHLNYSPTEKVAGPLWIGRLSDIDLMNKLEGMLTKYEKGEDLPKAIVEMLDDKKLYRFLKRLCEEKNSPPFYRDTHSIAKLYKIEPQSIDKTIAILRKKGYSASRTHFLNTAIKTNAPTKEIVKAMKEEQALNKREKKRLE